MAKEKIAILIPSLDTWHAGFGMSLASMVGYTEYKCFMINMRMSILCASREALLRSAIENDFDYALFLDTDMRFPEYTLDRLMSHQLDVVACNGVTKTIPPIPVARDMNSNIIMSEVNGPQLQPVRTVGLAVMLIRLSRIKDLAGPFFPIRFDSTVGTYAGEDLGFCRFLRDHAVSINVDNALSREIAHIGSLDYTLALT